MTAGSGKISIDLTSSSLGGTFSPNTVLIGAGSGFTTFRYTDTNSGTPTITATAVAPNDFLLPATQVETITKPATHVAFVQQPTSAASNATITPAVTVQLLDEDEHLVSNDSSSSITVAIGTNPNSGVLSGTATATAVNGVATFSGLSIDKAGIGYTLHATSGLLTAADSTAFDIGAGAPARVVFLQQPTSATAGVSIAPAITVQVQDAAGNPVIGSPISVTMTIQTNPGSGVLAGTTTVATSGGIATFSDLSINKAGVGYVLHAASGALTAANSSTFNITAAAATKLAFSTPPVVTAGSAFSLTINSQDAFGNASPVVADTVVDLSLTTGTGVFAGTLSRTILAGQSSVAFPGLTLSKAESVTITGSAVERRHAHLRHGDLRGRRRRPPSWSGRARRSPRSPALRS